MAFSAIKHFFYYPATYYVDAIAGARKGLFRLSPIYQNPSAGGGWLFDLFTRRASGYHGTSEPKIADQLRRGQFDKQGKPIYFGSKETAIQYAKRAAVDGGQPIVLEISSDIKPIMNDWLNQDLGWYEYFPPDPDKRVLIEAAYKVDSLGFINDQGKVDVPEIKAVIADTPDFC